MDATSPHNNAPHISRTMKIILAAAGAILLVYVLVIAWLSIPASMQVDRGQVAAQAKEITDYQLPDGFVERASTSIAGVERILIDDTGEQDTIWLVSGWEAGSDSPDMELRQGITFPRYRSIEWQAGEPKTMTVRGQQVSVAVYSGGGPNFVAYHAWACAFQGKNGPAILVIAGPETSWSDARAQAFINSMK
jgi:hypothetical protein